MPLGSEHRMPRYTGEKGTKHGRNTASKEPGLGFSDSKISGFRAKLRYMMIEAMADGGAAGLGTASSVSMLAFWKPFP